MKLICRAGLAASLVLVGALEAQQLTLTKSGGAVPGTTTMGLAGGDANALYVLVAAPREAATLLPSGAQLDVPLDWLSLFPSLGLIGHLDGAGRAQKALLFPNDASLVGRTISFQAVSAPGFSRVSNLVRLTLASAGTFRETLGAPALPMSGGAVVARGGSQYLLVGGSGPLAQVYDANREEFTLGGASFGVGLLSQATALADGRVLFSGGLAGNGQPTAAAALYDPSAGTTTVLTMGHARAGHGASLLSNGRVLITGGFAALDFTDPLALLLGIQNTTELFDPVSGAFVPGPSLLEARALHSSTSLATGGVLIAGGLSIVPIVNLPTVSSTAYEYNVAFNTFGLPRFMGTGRLMHSATRLANGKVLVVGGLGLDFTTFLATGNLADLAVTTHATGELYTGGLFGSFSAAGTLGEGRAGAGIVALPGNQALIAGGFEFAFGAGGTFALRALATAERFTGSTLAPTGAMAGARLFPLLTPLDDGTVLVLGGGALAAEVYQP